MYGRQVQPFAFGQGMFPQMQPKMAGMAPPMMPLPPPPAQEQGASVPGMNPMQMLSAMEAIEKMKKRKAQPPDLPPAPFGLGLLGQSSNMFGGDPALFGGLLGNGLATDYLLGGGFGPVGPW